VRYQNASRKLGHSFINYLSRINAQQNEALEAIFWFLAVKAMPLSVPHDVNPGRH